MYSILIVEDDVSYRNSMQMILALEGFEVRTAFDGQSGLASLREKRPDLILCDIMMPNMDGHSLLEALQDDRSLSDIPFIFVTAMGERFDVRRGMSAGADDYLPKPFSADELLAAVIGRINRHKLIQQRCAPSPFDEEQSVLRGKITKREFEVLLKVGSGATSKDIAGQLGICLKTVDAHRANLMNKLDAVNAASLARWAFIAEQMQKDSD